jgi:hypothetical protein
MISFILLFFNLSLSASEAPKTPAQKIVLSDEVLDQLDTINKVYADLVKGGMTPGLAAITAAKWQDKHYPIYLNPVKGAEYSKEKKKTDDSSKKD